MQEDILIQISNRLRELRKDKNITLQELADKAGVSKGLISQVENSRTIPSLLQIYVFLHQFNKFPNSQIHKSANFL